MKKTLCLALAVIMILSSMCVVAFAEDEIKVVINGTYLTMDQPPVIVNDRTLVPLRAIFEGLGATVSWDDATRTAIGNKDGKEIKITIDSATAFVDGAAVTLDVPAQIISDRTMVPVRFISESLGEKVDWDANTRTVIITSGIKLHKEWIFDNLTEFKNNDDFIAGGGISASNIMLSDEVDATTGSGKSIKMANRTSTNHRLKLVNAFSKADLGKTFTITAKAYLKDTSGSVRMGLYSTTNTEYATNPIDEISVGAEKDTWVDLKLTYKHENELITQIGFDQIASARCDNMYIDDVKIFEGTEEVSIPLAPGEIRLVKEWQFDDLDKFENNKDFIPGANYNPQGVSVSSDFDANGNGKSLKVDGRTNSNHRIKFLNAFSADKLGKAYTVKAKIYIPDNECLMRVGAYSDVNTTYATSPISSVEVKVAKNAWTEIEFAFNHEEKIVTQLGFDQPNSKMIPLFYIDDVRIYEGEIKEEEKIEAVSVTDGHRPVPTNFTRGKSYDDLIYFGEGKKTAEELLATLPEGTEVVGGSFITDEVEKDTNTYNYGKFEIIDVKDKPFTKAVRTTVYAPLEPPYAFQLQLGTPLAGKAQEGDVCLLRLWMRTESGGQGEAQMGNVMVVIEQNGGNHDKTIAANVTNGSEWREFYFPFVFRDNFTRATIRLAYYQQVVDIGGYTITNYGKDVNIDSLPTDTNSSPYLSRDAEWRREAWDRIEQIRKDDFKIVVKDNAGNIIPDADIKVDMYEHEFEWGVAVHGGVLNNDFYRQELQKNFNAAVLENHNKWAYYEKNTQQAKDILQSIQDLGINKIRGHVLLWDRVWTEGSTAVPDDLPSLYNDKEALQKRIKGHIDSITSELKQYIPYEWDVLNEAVEKHVMRDIYGVEIVKEWFDMARAAMGEEGRLYYNDFTLDQRFYDMMDEFVAAGVDFDGIGLQSHYGSPVNPESIYKDTYDKMAAYGKRLKVTEYDFITTDFELQANFTRDIMITAFSHPAMDGFIMWGFIGGPGEQYVLYDKDYNPKPSLEIWQDLIYNKWWTNEEGKTDANGAFNVNAYFGDYDITVTKDGITKTVTAKLYKDADRTIEVVIG